MVGNIHCRRGVFAACAILFVSTASAAWTGKTYTWTGNGGDGKWSNAENWSVNSATATTAPAEIDKLVFNSTSGSGVSYIDADFTPTRVLQLTLDTGFAGEIQMQRDFIVVHEYRQRAGTFTCGAHAFQCGKRGENVGGINPTFGHFYLHSGTFNPPNGSAFKWESRSHETYFTVEDAATFDCSNTDYSIYLNCQGGSMYWNCRNRTFKSFKIYTTATYDSASDTGCRFYGTNTVTGVFTHDGGALFDTGTASYGNAAFDLKGDLIVTNRPYGVGGKAGVEFLFRAPGDQTIWACLATNATAPGTCPIYVDKPSGKLTVRGDRLTVHGSATTRSHGLNFIRGDIDMSNLKWLSLSCYLTEFYHNPDECPIVWPDRVVVTGYTCYWRVRDQTFHHLRLNASDSKIAMPYAVTNTVTGWLEDYSFGMVGKQDTTWYPPSSNKNAYPVLLLRGEGVNVITNKTNTYGGNYNHSGGSGILIFDTDSDQRIIGGDSRVYLPTLDIQKPAGRKLSVETVDGRLGLRAQGSGTSGGHLYVRSGIFSGPTNRLDWLSYGSQIKQFDGAVITNMENTTIAANDWSPSIGIRAPFAVLTHDNNPASGSGNGVQVIDGYTCTVTRLVKSIRGDLKGNANKALLDIQGDFEVGTPKDAYCPIRFSGDQVQHFSNPSASKLSSRNWELAKSGGRVVLDTDMGLTNGTPQLTFTSGELDLNGHQLIMSGNLVLKGGATVGVPYAANAASPITVAGKVTNNATEANPFCVHLTSSRAELGQERVNLIDYGTLAAGYNPRAFTAEAVRPLRRIRLYDDSANKRLYLSYHFFNGMRIIFK